MTEQHFVILSMVLFVIGISGFFHLRKTILNLMLSLEIMLLAANINFVAAASYLHNFDGKAFALLTLVINAAEMVVGLSLFVNYYRKHQAIGVTEINNLKG